MKYVYGFIAGAAAVLFLWWLGFDASGALESVCGDGSGWREWILGVTYLNGGLKATGEDWATTLEIRSTSSPRQKSDAR